jgi:hypothetical protein
VLPCAGRLRQPARASRAGSMGAHPSCAPLLCAQGLLVAADISAARLRPLQATADAQGLSSTIATVAADLRALASSDGRAQLPAAVQRSRQGVPEFDKVLLDAPCSGGSCCLPGTRAGARPASSHALRAACLCNAAARQLCLLLCYASRDALAACKHSTPPRSPLLAPTHTSTPQTRQHTPPPHTHTHTAPTPAPPHPAGLGVVGKRADLRWRRTPEQVRRLQAQLATLCCRCHWRCTSP